jgi:hypothetical protein
VYRFPFSEGWYEATNECAFITKAKGLVKSVAVY